MMYKTINSGSKKQKISILVPQLVIDFDQEKFLKNVWDP